MKKIGGIPLNAVVILIAINLVVFGLMYFGVVQEQRFGLYFPENQHFGAWQFLTHLFLHGGVMHIVFNMYALLLFGTPLLQRWGSARFLSFYFTAGIGAGLVYTLANYWQFNHIVDDILQLGFSRDEVLAMLSSDRVPQGLVDSISLERMKELFSIYHSPAVGASGAIYGILVAFALMFPNIKLMLIFLPVPIAAKYFVPILIAFDMFFGLTKYSVGNVAHFAHVGGALVGFIYMVWWRWRVINQREG